MTCKQHSVAASAGVPTEEKRTRPFSTIACGFENVQRAAVENCLHVFLVPTALRVKDINCINHFFCVVLRVQVQHMQQCAICIPANTLKNHVAFAETHSVR